MNRPTFLTCVVLAALPAFGAGSQAVAQDRARYEKQISVHARANQVPEALVHRVIVRESKYHPDLIGRGGTIGLMQLKLATARGVGYTGNAEGLRDPETNLTYGVKYLAGAWRAAQGDHDRAVRYFASGYYYVAKQQRLERAKQAAPVLASAAPQEAVKPDEPTVIPGRTEGANYDAQSRIGEVRGDEEPSRASAQNSKASSRTSGSDPSDHPGMTTLKERAKPKQALAKPLQLVPKLSDSSKPKDAAAKPKSSSSKKLADAKSAVPRPPAAIGGGAKPATAR